MREKREKLGKMLDDRKFLVKQKNKVCNKLYARQMFAAGEFSTLPFRKSFDEEIKKMDNNISALIKDIASS